MTAWLKCAAIAVAMTALGCEEPCTPVVHNVAKAERAGCGVQHVMSTETINGQLYVMCTCPKKDVEK